MLNKTLVKTTFFHQCIDEYSKTSYQYGNLISFQSEETYSLSTINKLNLWLTMIQSEIDTLNNALIAKINAVPENEFCQVIDTYIDKKSFLEFELINNDTFYTNNNRNVLFHLFFKINEYEITISS